MRILVCSNILTEVQAFSYISHSQFWYRLGKEFPNDVFLAFFPHRTSIDNARNTAACIALEQECDYLLFYDDDMDLHPDTFKSLLAADKDIVMALSYIRGYPFHPMLFKEIGRQGSNVLLGYYDDYEEHINPEGLVECGAVGFATVLIKCDLLRKMQPPYFVTGSGMTEDVYFCRRAKEQFPETSIFTDTKCPTGHILNPELVHPGNVKKLRKFYSPNGEEEIPIENKIKDYEVEEILSWIPKD